MKEKKKTPLPQAESWNACGITVHGTDDLSRLARCKTAHRRKKKSLWETPNVLFLLLNIKRPPNQTSKFDASQLTTRDEAYLVQCFECNASLWRNGSLQRMGSYGVASLSSTNHNLLLPSPQLISGGNQTNLNQAQQYSNVWTKFVNGKFSPQS